MKFLKIILFLSIYSPFLFGQGSSIKTKFLQNVLREDFNEQNLMFPTTTETNGKYSMIMDNHSYYGLGSGSSEYPLLIQWHNDLVDFELNTSIRLKDEKDWEAIQKIQGQTGQVIGVVLKYNPNTQEALIFQINGIRQYKLSHLKDERIKSLIDWTDSKQLKRNDVNEITIRTKDNRYEFFINGKFEFKKNLDRLKENIHSGSFGFYLGKNTQAMINYFHVSTEKEYNGINKLLNLSEEDAKRLIAEKEQLKINLNKEHDKEIKELKDVIKIIENELKSANQIKDSIQKENVRYEPFKDIIEKNGDFMYTLTKDLREQMEKNKLLQKENNNLLDSITFLIQKQESFKLEYLEVLDQVMQRNDTVITEKKDTIHEKK